MSSSGEGSAAAEASSRDPFFSARRQGCSRDLCPRNMLHLAARWVPGLRHRLPPIPSPRMTGAGRHARSDSLSPSFEGERVRERGRNAIGRAIAGWGRCSRLAETKRRRASKTCDRASGCPSPSDAAAASSSSSPPENRGRGENRHEPIGVLATGARMTGAGRYRLAPTPSSPQTSFPRDHLEVPLRGRREPSQADPWRGLDHSKRQQTRSLHRLCTASALCFLHHS